MKLATSTTRLAPLLIAAVALISSSGTHTAAVAAQPSAICTTGAAPPSTLTLADGEWVADKCAFAAPFTTPTTGLVASELTVRDDAPPHLRRHR